MMNTVTAQPLMTSPFDGFIHEFVQRSGGIFTHDDFKDVQITFNENLAKDVKKERAVGVCYFTLQKPIRIEIDPRFWKENPMDQFALMFHEFGHCLCGLDDVEERSYKVFFDWLNSLGIVTVHDSNLLKDGCPRTLMYFEVVSRECVGAHFKYYMDELYGSCQKRFFLANMNQDWIKLKH